MPGSSGMPIVAGFVLLLAGLLASLVATHIKARRYFDRPALARNRLFDPVLNLLKWLLLLSGLALLARVSRPVALTAGASLLALRGYLLFIRSHLFQRRLLRRDFEALKKARPGITEAEILYELTLRRHPSWGPELVEQMVHDYPTVESLAAVIARMERGFRGFRA
ncbi:MAG TPA: hypothetical protein VFT43_10170 [Candidatus Polarisedimenticolia bacterium]|nr:hypothetical protein [Candidatus Polarisedimenticolia bacterium]